VQTKARAEQKAVEFLARKGIPTFVPRLLVRRRHGSRRWYALEPLFPGYLFARFVPLPDLIDRVRWTPGVRRLLGDEDGPAPLPDGVVVYLQERQGAAGFISPGQTLRPGTPVRFRHGPFALLEGIIDRPVSRADRVRVLLTLVNTSVAVEVHIDDLEET
jgi:transcriptional antiterminator RfaH